MCPHGCGMTRPRNSRRSWPMRGGWASHSDVATGGCFCQRQEMTKMTSVRWSVKKMSLFDWTNPLVRGNQTLWRRKTLCLRNSARKLEKGFLSLWLVIQLSFIICLAERYERFLHFFAFSCAFLLCFTLSQSSFWVIALEVRSLSQLSFGCRSRGLSSTLLQNGSTVTRREQSQASWKPGAVAWPP